MLALLALVNVLLLLMAVAAPVARGGVPSGSRRRAQWESSSGEESSGYDDALLALIRTATQGGPREAEGALGRISDRGRKATAALPSVLSVVRNETSPVRIAAAAAARRILNAAPEVAVFLWPDPSRIVRMSVAGVVARSGIGRRSEPARIIEEAFRDPDALVRRRTCERLSGMGTGRAEELLLRLLDDPDDEVHRVACERLAAVGGAKTLEGLAGRLVKTSARRRPALLRTLGTLGARHGNAVISLARTDASPAIRAAAADTIGAVGSVALADALLPLISDASKEVRVAAATAVQDVASADRTGQLSPAISDALVRQFERETSSSAILALLGALEAGRVEPGLDVILRRLPALTAVARERAIEVMASIQHQDA